MHSLKTRHPGPELMDDLTLASDDLRRNLDELATINTWLGGYAPVLDALERLKPQFPAGRPLRLADLGSGGGDTLRRIADWARKARVPVELVGVDANAFMLDYARARSLDYPEISYQQADIFAADFQKETFDVLTASLFCHHFTDDELIAMLRQWQAQTGLAVVINDLHRHWLAYASIWALTRLAGGSYLVRHDAPLSVARAFRRSDWVRLLAAAGVRGGAVRWRWAFRWQVVLGSGSVS